MNSKHYFGAVSMLSKLFAQHQWRRIFAVTGKQSYEKLPAYDYFESLFADKIVLRHSDFEPNPNYLDLCRGAKSVSNFSPDLIIGIGGGSVLDTAKTLSILPDNATGIANIIDGSSVPPKRNCALVLVPTTAGSGAESTHFSVAYMGGSKYSIASPFLLPDYSISDAQLTRTVPKRLTAITALDAFCQAVESYWSVGSTPKSRKYAVQAISLFERHFIGLLKNLNIDDRIGIMKCAHLSGLAINISKTTGPHALSYVLTSKFNIPHGHAVSLTLPEFIIKNASASAKNLHSSLALNAHNYKMNRLCQLFKVENSKQCAAKVRQLMRIAGLEVKLGQLGITQIDIDQIITEVNHERLSNNPRKLSVDDIKEIFYNAL